MFETIGVPELLIIGAVVLLLFGVGKVGRLGKDLGEGVKEFRRAMKEEDANADNVSILGGPPASYIEGVSAPMVAQQPVTPVTSAPQAQPGSMIF